MRRRTTGRRDKESTHVPFLMSSSSSHGGGEKISTDELNEGKRKGSAMPRHNSKFITSSHCLVT